MSETHDRDDRRQGLDTSLRGALLSRFGEMPRRRQRQSPRRGPRRPFGRTILLILAALPLFFGALACVALLVQTVREVGAAGAGNPDWVLVLAACFFAVMVLALIGTGFMVLRLRSSWLPAWIATLVIGLGGAVLGAQQLAAADWQAFSAAGGGAAIFLALSVYLAGVSAAGLRLKARRELFDDEG